MGRKRVTETRPSLDAQMTDSERDAFYDKLIDHYPFPLSVFAGTIKENIGNGERWGQYLATMWFFEATYRLMIALMLPKVLGGGTNDRLRGWAGLGRVAALLDLRELIEAGRATSQNMTLGAVAELYGDCLEIASAAPDVYERLPACLARLCTQKRARAEHMALHRTFVELRNRAIHGSGAGDGAVGEEWAGQAEVALRKLDRDLDLSEYETVWRGRTRSGARFFRVDHWDSQHVVLADPKGVVGEREVGDRHVALAHRGGLSRGITRVWSLHPLVLFSADEGTRAWCLFHGYESTAPCAEFDPARPTWLLDSPERLLVNRDAGYGAVIETLERYRNQLLLRLAPGRGTPQAKTGATALLSQIPEPDDPIYHGYDREMETAVRRLAAASIQPVHLVVHGLGGVGKTRFVALLVRRLLVLHASSFPGGFAWISAADCRVPSEAWEQLLRHLGASTDLASEDERGERLAGLRRALRERRMLVVLDDVDSSGVWEDAIRKDLAGVNLVVTTRGTPKWPGIVDLPLRGIEEGPAVALFRAVLTAAANPTDDVPTDEGQAARELVRQLGGHPLAIRITAKILAERGYSVGAFEERWRHTLDSMGLTEEQLGAVRACIRVSLDDLDGDERRVLCHLALWQGREASIEAVFATLPGAVPTRVAASGRSRSHPITGTDFSLVVDGRDALLRDERREARFAWLIARLEVAVELHAIGDVRDGAVSIAVADEDGRAAVVRLDSRTGKVLRVAWYESAEVSGPDLARFQEELARLVLDELREPPIGWVATQPSRTMPAPEDGLRQVIAALSERALVELSAPRIRLHPLVAEVALEAAGSGRRSGWRTVHTHYLRGPALATGWPEVDEANVRAAVDWIVSQRRDPNLLAVAEGALRPLGRWCRWPQLAALLDWLVKSRDGVDVRLRAQLADSLWRMGDLAGAEAEAVTLLEQITRLLSEEPVVSRLRDEHLEILGWIPFNLTGLALETRIAQHLLAHRRRPEAASLLASRLGAFLTTGDEGRDLWDALAEASRRTGDRKFVASHFYARYRAAEWRGVGALTSVALEAERRARAAGDDELLEAALIWLSDVTLASGDDARPLDVASVEGLLAELSKLAERTGSVWARYNIKLQRVFLLIREGRADEALAIARTIPTRREIPRAGHAPPMWFVAPYAALAAGLPEQARASLEAGVDSWAEQTVEGRWWTHALTAWVDLLEGDETRASEGWARASAYATAYPSPCRRDRFPHVFRALVHLDPGTHAVERASVAIWGEPSRRWRRVRAASYDLETERATMSLHVRTSPVTVGELREFCAETGAALPGLYRADGRTDRLDEPARFVPYELAEQLCRWLGHELPDSARWAGLGPEWTTREEPSFDSLSAWWHDDDDCERLRATWVASLSDEARAHADSVVRSESLSALDKWRLLCAVDTQGLAGLGPVGRAAVAMARDSVEPAFAVSGLVRRLRHDVRSLLHLTGAAEAAPAALWLRPATMVHDGRTSLLGVGALGDLGPSDRPSLLVPSRAAWADVLVWPAEMLDPTRYQERAHPWADRATRQERRT